MQGVCRGISLVRGATVPKEKAFFILGPHVTEGVGVRVFVLPDGPAAWEIRKGRDAVVFMMSCGSYFVAAGSYYQDSGREFR